MPAPSRLAPLLILGLAACGGVPDSGAGVGAASARGGGSVEGLTLAAAPAGAVLPFGQVATACGTPPSALGPVTEERSGYEIHDTQPGGTSPRTHFVTGFADGCPRQVTAALAVFGDPVSHETRRYRSSDEAYGPVDNAYEAIKGRVCGAPAGQPCGAAMDRLLADTAFLSVYPVFGGEAYADILFHAGEVVAVDPAP